MKNVPEIKMGIVVGSTDWLPSEIAVKMRSKLMENYKSIYGERAINEIYECPICITDNEINIKRAMRDLDKAGCNALCLYFANYGPESAGTLMAEKFYGPVMMVAAAEEGEEPYTLERKDALSGFINACYALNLRKTMAYIPSKAIVTVEQCVEHIRKFIPIAKVWLAIKELKIISFAPRPSSYLASVAPSHLLYDIGVEVAEYSELELFDSYHKHDGDSRITRVVDDMIQELGNDGSKVYDILPKLAQYEITVNDWIRVHKGDRKYVSLTSTCWPAFPVNFGFVPCYVNSRITKGGIPVACEVDLYGALSEYIGQCISNDIVTLLNLNHNVPKEVYEKKVKDKEFNGKRYSLEDLIIGYHCGVTCLDKLVSGKLTYHFVNHQLIGKEHSNGTIQGQILPGAVTLFRIQGMHDGKLRAYVVQGQILPITIDTYGGYGVIAVPEMERFIRNIVIGKHFPNHTVVVFGHYGNILMSVLKQLGVEEIYYNHPKNIPYKNENIFNLIGDWY